MKEVKVVSSIAKKKGFGATLWDYLTTVDHKKIAILYLIAGGLFFVIGGIEAMLIRIQLQNLIMILLVQVYSMKLLQCMVQP